MTVPPTVSVRPCTPLPTMNIAGPPRTRISAPAATDTGPGVVTSVGNEEPGMLKRTVEVVS